MRQAVRDRDQVVAGRDDVGRHRLDRAHGLLGDGGVVVDARMSVDQLINMTAA